MWDLVGPLDTEAKNVDSLLKCQGYNVRTRWCIFAKMKIGMDKNDIFNRFLYLLLCERARDPVFWLKVAYRCKQFSGSGFCAGNRTGI